MKRLATLFGLLLLLLSFPVQAAAPAALSYQGFLTDSVGNPVSGTWTVTFGLFSTPAGGAALFEESLDVTTDKGLFSVYLGTPDNPLPVASFENGKLFLELTVETDDGPVALTPRQQVVSDPYALYAQDAAQLGGEEASAFVLLQQLPDLCITPEALPDVLAELGITGGGLDEEALAAWLLANFYMDETSLSAWLLANGYDPCACYGDEGVAAYLAAEGFAAGPHFSGLYEDLMDPPDLSAFMTAENVAEALSDLGAVLLADGSVALEGNLDLAGFQALNLAVHNSEEAPEEPTAGQLWWDLNESLLKVYTGEAWSGIGTGVAGDIACPECVDADDVAFTFAAADQKGGAALNVNCFQCINADEVSFAWAKGVLPGGDAEHALTADTATSALTAELAQDVECPGCVSAGDIDPNALDSKVVKYDGADAGLAANSVQGAIDELAASGSGDLNEGNGTIVPYVQQWGLPAYGKAENHIHLMNPSQPKVVAHVYASESTSFATSNNLVVAYDHTPNQYSGVSQGTAGASALEVGNPSIFNYGNHILVHQSVGTGGNGAGAGNWELNQVIGVNGNTLLLAKPLENTYSSGDCANGRAQAVVAASYNLLEVVSGGAIRPSEDWSTARGGIVYIRARKVIVKSGGKIEANERGFWGGNSYACDPSWSCEKGHSECNVCDNLNTFFGTDNNCSGGGGGNHSCWNPAKGGGGGGGNKTAGQSGSGSEPGKGGATKGNANLSTLQFGGGGGRARTPTGGAGGGLVVLGAESIIVEPGGVIAANGGDGASNSNGNYAGGGGGAGGTVVLYAEQVMDNGTISATGGTGGTGPQGNGGDGGEGWVVQVDPISGVVNESYPKGLELWVDGKEVTPLVGDPNGKGPPSWDAEEGKWGQDGLTEWNTGPLDLTSVANWTLGEHTVALHETGGAGGELKLYLYVIYPFTKSSAPGNDSCDGPTFLNLADAVTVSGTTEDIMGKIKATDASQAQFCGGSGGPDAAYAFTLDEWRQIAVNVVSPFTPRTYIKKADCVDGEVAGCGTDSWNSKVLEPGTYYFFVDGDGNLQKGDFSFTLTPSPPGPPGNDTCAAPMSLVFQNGTAQVNEMSLFATDAYSAVCGGTGAPDLVYTFDVAPNTSQLSITVEGEFNPAIYVTKDSCDANPIACVPQGSYQMGWPTPGTYFLFVDGKTAPDKGIFTLTLTTE